MDHSMSQSQANQQRQRGRPRLTETAAASVAELLGLVRKHQALTRLELEKISSFGRAVVSDRLTVLSELGLAHENETGISGGGRVPRIVSSRTGGGPFGREPRETKKSSTQTNVGSRPEAREVSLSAVRWASVERRPVILRA